MFKKTLQAPFLGVDGRYHYLYQITNIINQKYYIGIHSTRDLDDGYMGSGQHLMAAKKKYGLENFRKDILEFFSTREELSSREREIVNEDFVRDKHTYNLVLGGDDGVSDYHKTPVSVYDQTGRLLMEFSSSSEAAAFFGLVSVNSYVNRDKLLFDEYLLRSFSKVTKDVREKTSKRMSYPVRVYDTSGKFLREYPSKKALSDELGIHHTTLKPFLNREKAYKGRYILRSDNVLSERTLRKRREAKCLPVFLCDLNGDTIREYESRTALADDLGVSPTHVSHIVNRDRVLLGKYRVRSEYTLPDSYLRNYSSSSRQPVLVYNTNGELVSEIYSVTEAKKIFDNDSISCYLDKNKAVQGKYFLKKKRTINLNHLTGENDMTKDRYIGVFDLDNNFIGGGKTLREAADIAKCSPSSVHVYCKSGKPFKGHFFREMTGSIPPIKVKYKGNPKTKPVPVTVYNLEGEIVQTFPSFRMLESFYNNRCMERYVNKERIFREKYIIRNEKFDPTKVTPFVFQKKEQKPVVEVRCDGFEIMTSALKNTIMDCTRKVFVRLGDLCRIPA